MNNLTESYFPAQDARELNKRLRLEHFNYLEKFPNWAPNELSKVPRVIIRFFNRLARRLPLTEPLGWIDGKTPADDEERNRIELLLDQEKESAQDLHARAIYGRCFRIRKFNFSEPMKFNQEKNSKS
tara:strand:- start:346 stop:726 length:381 start_codon:yes stop_codon:yes gene_type:complete